MTEGTYKPSEKQTRALIEERDQLRQKVRDLEETLGEALEALDFLRRENRRERAYRGFRNEPRG